MYSCACPALSLESPRFMPFCRRSQQRGMSIYSACGANVNTGEIGMYLVLGECRERVHIRTRTEVQTENLQHKRFTNLLSILFPRIPKT